MSESDRTPDEPVAAEAPAGPAEAAEPSATEAADPSAAGAAAADSAAGEVEEPSPDEQGSAPAAAEAAEVATGAEAAEVVAESEPVEAKAAEVEVEPEPAPAEAKAEIQPEAAQDKAEAAEPEAVSAPAQAKAAEAEPEPAPAPAEAAEAEAASAPAEAKAAEAEPQPAPAEAEAAKVAAEPEAGAAESPAPDDAAPDDAKVVAAEGDTEAAAEGDDADAAPDEPEKPEVQALRRALEQRESIEARVIGWNNGGFHLAIDALPAFCPMSEMELGTVEAPESYLDRTLQFRVLRIHKRGRRIVVSRAAHLRGEHARQRVAAKERVTTGAVLDGRVASLTDFGAFVDLGGLQGLVHVSEIARRRVERPSDVLEPGQTVRVKVLKVEKGGRRISLSMKALEPDPWQDVVDQFPRGKVVKGRVEKATSIGAFIELAPGVTGLLPARSMSIPRETSPARAFPPGKEVSVQVMSVDRRRRRIALALEGSNLEGSRADFKEYQKRRSGSGFNALESAFRRIDKSD